MSIIYVLYYNIMIYYLSRYILVLFSLLETLLLQISHLYGGTFSHFLYFFIECKSEPNATFITTFQEEGINLMTVIKGTMKYRRSRKHDFVLDFLPPSRTEIEVAFEQMMG